MEKVLIYLLYITLSLIPSSQAQEDFSGTVWPISGSKQPDLIQSNQFGPRIKASENYRYDWHRGVDIPCPKGTPLHAISDGTVRLAGNYSNYKDTILQVKHYFGTSVRFYAQYLHVYQVFVSEGEEVTKGQVIGTSGPHEGFKHLHFEIRKGSGYQKNCINPWEVLPHDIEPKEDFHLHIEDVTQTDTGSLVSLYVTQPGNYLTLNTIMVECLDSTGLIQNQQVVDFNEWTYECEETKDLDNSFYRNVEIFPEYFGTQFQDHVAYTFIFHDVLTNEQTKYIRAKIYDVDLMEIEYQIDFQDYQDSLIQAKCSHASCYQFLKECPKEISS